MSVADAAQHQVAVRRAQRLLSAAVASIEPELRLRRLLAARPEHHPRHAAEQERAVALARLRRADESCVKLGSRVTLLPPSPTATLKADKDNVK